ncbi:hypothetical protein ACNQR7_07800 [Mycolicibacterium senegalense]|uniref:hypothetical protein n=1 Tax=Mycolicibacterium senegalense TaxID=1796 RepID=UPI003AAC5C63
MSKIPIAAVGITLVAATALAGCAAEPAPETGAAPSTSTVASAHVEDPHSAVTRYLGAQMEAKMQGWKLNAAAALPRDADRGLAEAAVADGVPFAVSYRFPTAADTCAWVRLPNGSLWSLNGDANALTRDTTAEEYLRLGYPSPAPTCEGGTTTAGRFNAAAETAALAAGAPYRWTDGCKQYVRIPGSKVRFWIPDTPPAEGEALSNLENQYSCGGGVVLPEQTPGGN